MAEARRASGVCEAFLGAPGGVLAVPVEADIEEAVTENVVHGPEPVVFAPDLATHQRVLTVARLGRGRDLHDTVSCDRRDEFASRYGTAHVVKKIRTDRGAWVRYLKIRSVSLMSWA